MLNGAEFSILSTKGAFDVSNADTRKPRHPRIGKTYPERDRSILDHREKLDIRRQFLASRQKRQLRHESYSQHISAYLLQKLIRSGSGTTCRQQIVNQNDAIALVYCIDVNLHGIRAIFQLIRLALDLVGKFARF